MYTYIWASVMYTANMRVIFWSITKFAVLIAVTIADKHKKKSDYGVYAPFNELRRKYQTYARRVYTIVLSMYMR